MQSFEFRALFPLSMRAQAFWVANATDATLSEWIGATLDAGKRDLRRFTRALPPELVMQPLMSIFLAVSYE
ncbi:hypothetical protein [Pseudomonas sp. KU43P]|uniref:hypothetical protein n=1 Tax=Pseudomonas sp. KU43P TaxID=2487887 RepID=UPI0029549927|nr:hypothetical protein [Pseudomonas sp. KU43P]